MADNFEVIRIRRDVLLSHKKRYLLFLTSGLITDMFALELIITLEKSV